MLLPPGRDAGGCDVTGGDIYIYVATNAADATRIQEMPDPKRWGSITWVTEPAWFVTTVHREAALEVQHAIGRELHGVDV